MYDPVVKCQRAGLCLSEHFLFNIVLVASAEWFVVVSLVFGPYREVGVPRVSWSRTTSWSYGVSGGGTIPWGPPNCWSRMAESVRLSLSSWDGIVRRAVELCRVSQAVSGDLCRCSVLRNDSSCSPFGGSVFLSSFLLYDILYFFAVILWLCMIDGQFSWLWDVLKVIYIVNGEIFSERVMLSVRFLSTLWFW